MVEYLLSSWARTRDGLITTVGKFDDRELTFRPFERGRSVAEIALHIAHEERGEIQHGITGDLAEWPPEYDARAFRSVKALVSLLTEVHERTVGYLKSIDDGHLERMVRTPWGSEQSLMELVGHVVEHEVHHRGELSLILGLLGREGLDA
jgi:uncharacterized damage-inducible protein DinB